MSELSVTVAVVVEVRLSVKLAYGPVQQPPDPVFRPELAAVRLKDIESADAPTAPSVNANTIPIASDETKPPRLI